MFSLGKVWGCVRNLDFADFVWVGSFLLGLCDVCKRFLLILVEGKFSCFDRLMYGTVLGFCS